MNKCDALKRIPKRWKRKWLRERTTINGSCLYSVKAVISCAQRLHLRRRHIEVYRSTDKISELNKIEEEGRMKESLAFKPKPKRLPLSSVKLLGLCGTFDILNVFTVWRMWNTFPENWFYKQHLRNFKNICAAVVCTLCACQKFAAHLIYHCAFLVKSCQPMNQQKTCIVSWVQNLLHCPAIPDYSWWMMWLKSTPSLLVTNQSPL